MNKFINIINKAVILINKSEINLNANAEKSLPASQPAQREHIKYILK